MTVRGDLADWIRQLPDQPAGLRVVDSPRTVDPVPGVMVHLARTAVNNPADSGSSSVNGLTHDLDLWLVLGALDPAVAEDPLDAALDWLLEAFAGHAWLLWTQASRADYDNGRGNAYRIPLTVKSIRT